MYYLSKSLCYLYSLQIQYNSHLPAILIPSVSFYHSISCQYCTNLSQSSQPSMTGPFILLIVYFLPAFNPFPESPQRQTCISRLDLNCFPGLQQIPLISWRPGSREVRDTSSLAAHWVSSTSTLGTDRISGRGRSRIKYLAEYRISCRAGHFFTRHNGYLQHQHQGWTGYPAGLDTELNKWPNAGYPARQDSSSHSTPHNIFNPQIRNGRDIRYNIYNVAGYWILRLTSSRISCLAGSSFIRHTTHSASDIRPGRIQHCISGWIPDMSSNIKLDILPGRILIYSPRTRLSIGYPTDIRIQH